jgi:hypothetical protein
LRCRHGPQERGTRLRLRTTRNCWLSGDAPLEEVEEGGVGWFPGAMLGWVFVAGCWMRWLGG